MDDYKFNRELFKQLKKYSNDPEQLENYLNQTLEKRIPSSVGTTTKATETDRLLHNLLGEAALDEIPGLQNKPLIEALQEVKDSSNKGLGDLERSVDINPKISVEDLKPYEERAKGRIRGVFSAPIGTKVSKDLDIPKNIESRQSTIGTSLHESGHSLDEVAKRLAQIQDELEKRSDPEYKRKKFRKVNVDKEDLNFYEMLTDDELFRYNQNVKDKLEQYVKNNPDKLQKMFSDPGMSKFQSQKVPKFLTNEKPLKPLEAQKLYSGAGHWFKRNFPFENLKNVLKGGIKTIRGVGVGLIPATAAALTAAYSPDSKADTVAKTAQKITDEGDPLSFIFPSEAGAGEEEEIKKMYEEAKKNKFKKLKQKLKE
jgi:hypothetical protein